jgi:hypothetical protein
MQLPYTSWTVAIYSSKGFDAFKVQGLLWRQRGDAAVDTLAALMMKSARPEANWNSA